MLGWTYACQGAYEQAIKEHEKIGPSELSPVTEENQFFAAGLGWIYGLAGRRNDALRVLAQFEELEKNSFGDQYNIATIYLGDNDQAFRTLDRGFLHSGSIVFLKGDPFWSTVRSDPRYAELLRRMGLPP